MPRRFCFDVDPGLSIVVALFPSEFFAESYFYLLGVVGFAGLIHGAMGIGFPMVATPLIAIVMDVRLAVLLTLLPTVVVNVASIKINDNVLATLRPYGWLFLSSLIGGLLGTLILASVDSDIFRLVLAGLILLFLCLTVTRKLKENWADPQDKMLMFGFGFVAGVSAGTTNVMVAILIIYMIGLGLGRIKMIPVLNTCFLIGKLAQITVFSLSGWINLSLILPRPWPWRHWLLSSLVRRSVVLFPGTTIVWLFTGY